MKTFLLIVLVSLSLVVLTRKARAFDETPFDVKVNIPFTFYAGNTMLPPGHYVIRQLRDVDEKVFELQGEDHMVSVLLEGRIVQAEAISDKAQVMFKKYGDKEILYRFFALGQSQGIELDLSIHEKQAVKSGAAPEKHAVEATSSASAKKPN
jgi:hypothetical protein